MKVKIGSVVATMLLVARAAGATPVTLAFDSSLLFGLAGTTVTFVGTVTDVGNSETFLNGDTVSVSPPLVADDTPFLTNFPFLLLPLQLFHAPILSVGIPAAAPAGLYSGTFQLIGGTDAAAVDVLATQTFAVQVQAATQPVPEPITAVLLSGGAAGALWRSRRQRERSQSTRRRTG